MAKLTELEKNILELRSSSPTLKSRTFEEIGKELGYTRQHMAQKFQDAIAKLTPNQTKKYLKKMKNTKFIFILPAKMNQYLKWKSESLDISRADLVRSIVSEKMAQDKKKFDSVFDKSI